MGKAAEVFAPLSNLVGRSEHRAPQVKAIRAYLAGLDGKRCADPTFNGAT
jgi:hypothetical protein